MTIRCPWLTVYDFAYHCCQSNRTINGSISSSYTITGETGHPKWNSKVPNWMRTQQWILHGAFHRKCECFGLYVSAPSPCKPLISFREILSWNYSLLADGRLVIYCHVFSSIYFSDCDFSTEPMSVDLHVDGVNDPCSQGKDINFTFLGFSVTGQVQALTNRAVLGWLESESHSLNDLNWPESLS